MSGFIPRPAAGGGGGVSQGDVDTSIATHSADTTNVHGVINTANLATPATPTGVLVFGTDIALTHDWDVVAASGDGAYRASMYLQGGRVYLTGTLVAGATSNEARIGQIPEGYRPDYLGAALADSWMAWAPNINGAPGETANFAVFEDGGTYVLAAGVVAGDWIYLDGISWPKGI